MSPRIFTKILNPIEMLAIQKHQSAENLIISDTVPANSSKTGKVSIGNQGAFFCDKITGTFSTLKLGADNTTIIDNGVGYLSGQLTDQTGQKRLFNDYIPLGLILSPGRSKSNLAANNAGNITVSAATVFISGDNQPLFYPLEFNYLFPDNTEIQFDVKNNSDTPNTYTIVFHGIRILSQRARAR
jgi:hypothetical protein